MNYYAYLYQITNIKNNMVYVGITYSSKRDKTIHERFAEHMKGNGSSRVKIALGEGYDVSDFKIELLEKSKDIEYLRDREIEEIKNRNTLHPNGYNGNLGKVIIMTEEIKKKISNTKRKKYENGEYDRRRGFANYKSKNDPTKIEYMKTDDPRVLSGEYVGLLATNNTIPLPIRLEKKAKIKREKEKNGGKTNKELEVDEWMRGDEFREIITNSDGWKQGRQKLRDRLAKKEFTEKELKRIEKTSSMVKENWESLSEEEIYKKTKPGLDSMNSKRKCKYCDFEANRGNITRWHDEKCKYKGTTNET
jgi:hypothetical protein